MNSTLPRVQSIQARAVNVPMPRPMRTAAGEIPSAPLILVDIVTNEGTIGRSYIFAYTTLVAPSLLAMIEQIKPLLIDKEIAPVARMAELRDKFRLLGLQGILGMALSGLELALWDALAQISNMTVCRLLGGDDRATMAYDSFGFVDPGVDLPLIEHSLERGFRAFKIKTGYADRERDVASLMAVREMVGPNVSLMVDFNQTLTTPEAMRRIEALMPLDLVWVEEPVPAEDIAGHKALRDAYPGLIQTGENWWSPHDAQRSISACASDYVMLDIIKIGGVTGWIHAAGIAAGASLPVSSHLFTEMSAHLMPVTPLPHYLEYLDVAGPILLDELQIENGRITPMGNGFGLRWDETAVENFAL